MTVRTTLLVFCLFANLAQTSAQTEMAITFNDLQEASPFDVKLLVESLKKNRIHGVYAFVSGKGVRGVAAIEESLNMWRNAGHKFGNHTFTHMTSGVGPVKEMIEDIEKNETVLVDYARETSELKVMRFPFYRIGSTEAAKTQMQNYLNSRNYKIAEVTIGFDDYPYKKFYEACLAKGQGALDKLEAFYLQSAVENLRFAIRQAREIFGEKEKIKHILRIHPIRYTSLTMSKLIAAFKKEGVKFISLENAMSDPLFSRTWTDKGIEDLPFLDRLQASLAIKILDRPSRFPAELQKQLTEICGDL